MVLPDPSDEQKDIVKTIRDYNLIVDSVAGSGKTTTNLHISSFNSDKDVLILTYNSKLKDETRIKVTQLELLNTEVHSYHSFCYKYYNYCIDDNEIKKIVNKDKPLKTSFKFDIIVVDEAQDMTELYFMLVCKIIKDNKFIPNICVMGDRCQAIYDFNRADSRFITLADQIFCFNNVSWKEKKLSVSFRMNKPAVEFVNRVMLNEHRLNSIKNYPYQPRYVIGDFFNDTTDIVYNEIKRCINMGYTYSDIFILAQSLKSDKSPVKILANRLTDKNIPIYVPLNDDEKIKEHDIENKVLFSTFHQAKGLERKVVVIFSFDDSYLNYYKQNSDPTICPNELYVAATRSLEQTIFLHQNTNDYLPFIDKTQISKTCEVVVYKKLRLSNKKKNNFICINIDNLIKYLPQDVIEECLEYIDIQKVDKPKKKKIMLARKAEQKKKSSVEAVSNITNKAVFVWYEYKKTGKLESLKEVYEQDTHNNKYDEYQIIEEDDDDSEQKNDNDIDIDNLKVSELLKLCNRLICQKTGYNHKKSQIDTYDWIKEDILNKCVKRIDNLKITDPKFNTIVKVSKKPELLRRKLSGSIDLLNDNTACTIRSKNRIEDIDKLYHAVVMYLTHKNISTELHYYLYNVVDNTLLEFFATTENLEYIIEKLIRTKFFKTHKTKDSEFIDSCLIINKKYIHSK